MTLLTCKNLSIGYGSHAVMENISFAVSSGDYLCILGRNGTGKSTLLKTLAHLLEPLHGSVCYGDGVSRKDVGYLGQRLSSREGFPATVKEVVMSGFANRRMISLLHAREEKRLAEENMRLMEVGELANRRFSDLSGGQQQRVLLARALCASGKLLLLDEPVAGLDALASGQMYSAVERLNREKKTAVIMVSHDVDAAMNYATHVLYLAHDGAFYGTREAFAASVYARAFSKGEVKNDA